MRRIVLFLVLLGWFLVTDLLHSLAGPSYVLSFAIGLVTIGVLYVPRVRKRISLEPVSAGIVVLVTSALGVLFVNDNVVVARSVWALLINAVVFSLSYLLFQGRLERDVERAR